MATLRQVKQAQPEWFSRDNKRFFGDVSYRVLHSKATGDPYLVRKTSAFTDMFGQSKRYHYRINPLDSSTLKIQPLIDSEFGDLWAVKRWLKEH